eukprot:TRINITY_DN62755_c0_g1_i1.p1 TRINITY_DN62755_c0_g1~~TRINITY_DN62755_c0_g1_i1.p1  ORF type:complete len:629 (-),score=104.46 TRINITY_DN62755_c0_g1_i1:123-2009(-)
MPKAPESLHDRSASSGGKRGGSRKGHRRGSSDSRGASSRKSEEPAKNSASADLKAFAPEFVPGAGAVVPRPDNMAAGCLATSSRPAQPPVAAGYPALQDPGHSGEHFLMEMLAAMDQHMQQLRETQQGLVATVELACRRALDRHFGRLVLVGSAALRVETPGSDVDVVCFTRRDGPETVGLPADVLRRVHWSLKELISQYSDYPTSFSMELIDDARVPILRVLWGPPEHAVAVDVSVDQHRPLDHVRWFQRVGAAPRPTEPPPVVAPLVTLTLRCVKWWLKQRQIPRTKEGGLPTMAWLLMAVHVCSLPETHEQAMVSGQRPMAALLASLAAFFRHYQSLDRLDGVLQFAADGTSSEFRMRAERGSVGTGPASTSPWAELAVLDPTREGLESLNLIPRLPPATQLLLSHELSRAHARLEAVPRSQEASFGESRRILEEAFRPLPEGTNALPSFIVSQAVGALVVCGEASPGSGVQQVEVAVIESVTPRPGWTAPFLLRGDERSEVAVILCDLEERTARCRFRGGKAPVKLSPANFVCRVHLERHGREWRIDAEGLDRFRAMRGIIGELLVRRQKLQQQALEAAAATKGQEAEAKELAKSCADAEAEEAPGLKNVTNLPSPSRSARTSI